MSTGPSTGHGEGNTAVDASQMSAHDGQDPLTESANIEHDPRDLNCNMYSTTRNDFRRAAPKTLASGALCYSSDNDISPASTFGTTLSGGESAPVTPLTPTRDHFSQEADGSLTVSFDETEDREPNAEPQPKLLDRLVSARSPKQHLGGVSLPQMKADSCPDRLSSMVRDLELNESSGTSDSPNSLVTEIRHSQNVSPAATPTAHESPETFDQKAQEAADITEHTAAVTAENAQSIYPPEASVFVANLAKDNTDEELLRDLHRVFDEFGDCWILIRRDAGNHIPFAFVQYKTKDDAQLALQEGLGKLICGRSCRVEASRAHRAVYVTRKDGEEPTLDEVKSLLKDYKTSEVWTPTRTEIETYGFGDGIWVRFDLFGECKEAVRALRNDQNYHLVYKDFDKRHKMSKARGYGMYRPWRPRPQNPPPKRVVVAQPWGSPYLANAVPASANVVTGNAGWYNPYSNAASATPLPPMLCYAQATGQATVHSASTNGVVPLLHYQAQGTTPTSGPMFTNPDSYAVAQNSPGMFAENSSYAITHQPPALYSQSSMSSISPISPSYDHLFFNSQSVSPVSAHDANGVATAFPAFHAPNFTTSTQPGMAYYHTVHPANVFTRTLSVTNPMDQQVHNMGTRQVLASQQQSLYPMNTGRPLDGGSRPTNATRANAPSPFHRQLPESFTAPSAAGYRAVVANTVPGQHELPTTPTAFGYDGTFQYYVPGQNADSLEVSTGTTGVTVAQSTSTEAHEVQELPEHSQQDSTTA